MGSMFNIGHNQDQADDAYKTAGQQAKLPGELQGQWLPQMLQYLHQMAMNSTPYGNQTQQNAGTDPLTMSNLASQSMTPAFNTELSQYGDNVARQTNTASQDAAHQMAGRGFAGANTLLPSQLAQIQLGSQGNVDQTRGQVGVQAAGALTDLAKYQQAIRYQQAKNLGDTMWTRAMGMTSAIPSADIQGQESAGNYWKGLADQGVNQWKQAISAFAGGFGGAPGAGGVNPETDPGGGNGWAGQPMPGHQ